MYMCILDLADESQHSLSMWQHALGACIKHCHEMEERHEVTTYMVVVEWKRRKEEHSHALHRDE